MDRKRGKEGRERERERGDYSQHFITSESDLDTSCWNRLVRPLLLDNRTCATLSKTASAAHIIQYYGIIQRVG